jgi:nicotinate-nucleotide--dimethylbenzimidazole phosphoribosyltransferase
MTDLDDAPDTDKAPGTDNAPDTADRVHGEEDLAHHGDAELGPGLLDLAVNVRHDPLPVWLSGPITAACAGLAAYPDAGAATAAIASRHGRQCGEVLVTAGAAEAFTLIAQALRRSHRGVAIMIHPQFTEPEVALRAAGWQISRVLLDASDDFSLASDLGSGSVAELVPEDATVVVIGNPTNPTGALHSRAALLGLRRPDRIVVVDEAFMDSVPGEPESLTGEPDLTGLLIVRSLTKTWGLAGLRIGYLLGDPRAIANVAAVQPRWSVSAPALSAAAACMTDTAARESERRAADLTAGRERLRTGLSNRGFAVAKRSYGPFLLVRHPDRLDLHQQLRCCGIAVRRADTFPGLGAGWVRVSVRNDAATDALFLVLDEIEHGALDQIQHSQATGDGIASRPPRGSRLSPPPIWPRPVPTVGDTTAASQRAADPSGWALDETTIAALHRVIGARRDIRRFRPDPIDIRLLRTVLAAGHQAPSVGHSQPWRFIVVTEQTTRDRAALMADRERLRQANQLKPDRRGRLLDLQLEGIREAPIGIVIACDRRAAAGGVLGRATFADADLWSCACAIENIWLAARAEGLGLGWVTLFQPAELASLLRLPDGVETLGWLCLGWPDERPPDPGLERAGWSQRLSLDDVVLAEHWPATDEPAVPDSHLAVQTSGDVTGAQLAGKRDLDPQRPLAGPDQAAVVAARDTGDRLLTAAGSLGVLDTAINRLHALGHGDVRGGTLVLVAAEHPVTCHGISAYPVRVTRDVFEATQRGQSLGATTARAAGLGVEAHWATTTEPQGDLVTADALSLIDVTRLIKHGRALGIRAASGGLVCLGEVAVGNTSVAAALTCALLGVAVSEAVGLGAGADAAMLTRKQDVVTAAVDRATREHRGQLGDPVTALAALGGPEFAVLAGVVLGAASAGAAVVLDGQATCVAALIAVQLDAAAQTHLIAGQRSRERAQPAVLAELGLEPLLELRIRAGEGVGACLAAQLLLTGLTVRRTAGRVRY